MATTFIAKHGLKSNINKLKLSEGEIAIAYSEDKTKAEIYSGSKDGTPILLVPEVDVAELLANAQEYTNTKISELVDGAPEAMDTLKELADAISKNSDIMSALQSAIGNKANVADLNTHTSDTSNPHGVTKEQVGLGNVDNTSDIDKPVSTATQEALDGKASKSHASTTINYGVGSASNYGHVRLYDGVDSTANMQSGTAATPKAVLTAYEKAVGAYNLANGKLDKTFNSNGFADINEVTERLGRIEEGAEVNKVTSVQGRMGDVTITKLDLGLDNVENVSTNKQTPTFTEASTRVNIASGETLSTLFGKIKKFFTDLKTVAFTGSYTDLSNKPTSMQNPNSLTLTMNGSSSSYNGASSASKSWYAPTSGGTAGYSLIGSGSGAPVWKQPPYAVCGDSPSISDRRVSITNFKLITGARVLVKFSYPYASTATTVTLNVNGTGAKTIKLRDAVPSTTNTWESNEIVEFLYDGSYWVAISSDKQGVSNKPSVITVGSSTTTRYCDFKCTGTNDQTVIQNAINTLTAGGKIILLEGTYNFSNGITHKNDVVIEGQGKGITIINETFPQMISKMLNTSATLAIKNMSINFAVNGSSGPDTGAFNNYTSLEFDNCSITYANKLHSRDSLFKNCNVRLNNSQITVTLPADRYDSSHVCWWVFRECTVELTNTGVLFPSGSNNTLSNGVFYACNGTMFGGFIQHIGTTISSTHSYVESFSAISFVGTQIECRRFSQTEVSTGDFNTLSNCRIKILQASGYFNASHISHCDFYIAGAIIFCAYCMASNSKLWFSAASLATLRNYCYFEACYVNQSTWISSQGTGVSTTDTKTGISITAPSFRSVS